MPSFLREGFVNDTLRAKEMRALRQKGPHHISYD